VLQRVSRLSAGDDRSPYAAHQLQDGRSGPDFRVHNPAALLMLGVMSSARLADLAVPDAYYARAIGRIRSFYFDVAGDDTRHYWLFELRDERQCHGDAADGGEEQRAAAFASTIVEESGDCSV